MKAYIYERVKERKRKRVSTSDYMLVSLRASHLRFDESIISEFEDNCKFIFTKFRERYLCSKKKRIKKLFRKINIYILQYFFLMYLYIYKYIKLDNFRVYIYKFI
jgi:hypothetical protein